MLEEEQDRFARFLLAELIRNGNGRSCSTFPNRKTGCNR